MEISPYLYGSIQGKCIQYTLIVQSVVYKHTMSQASGIHIEKIPHAHVTTITCDLEALSNHG